MTKSLLLIGTLALAGIASAKSYDITLSAPSTAAGMQIAAGNYAVKVIPGFAVFTNVDNGKKYLAPVKTQDAGKKFDQTAVGTKTQDGARQLTTVELGGSSTVIELGE